MYYYLKENKELHYIDNYGIIMGDAVCQILNEVEIYLLDKFNGEKSIEKIIDEIVIELGANDKSEIEDVVNRFIKNKTSILSVSEIPSSRILYKTGVQGKKYPYHLILSLTNKCNLMCKHCYKNCNISNNDSISYIKLMNTLTKLKNKSRSIQLTGGEPMLYDRFFEILDYCKNNFRTNITTSATHINDSNVENFKGVQFVQVSLYSEKEREHEEVTQVKESYKNTIKGIKHLVNNKIPTNVATIATKNNINKMEDMIKFLINIGVTRLNVGLVSKWGRALQLDDSWTLNSEEKSRISDILEELNIKHKKYITVSTWKNKDIILNADNEIGLSCGAGLLTWVISEKGTIKPCELFPDSLFSLGNIFEDDIEEIVNKYTLENMSKGIAQWEKELRQNKSSLRDICQVIEKSRRN